MIEGLALTPPVLGRISIGKIVEKNGKRLPEKDDEFTVTSLVQNRDGWINHPLDEVLRKAAPDKKLRSIPVKLLFADPDLSFRAQYGSFDRNTGRPMCSGDGKTCKRITVDGLVSLPCPTPENCTYSDTCGCKPYGRLNVQIDGQDDDLGSFIFRTTGYNSIRTLSARLLYFKALLSGALPSLPLSLKLRAKSTTQSHRSAVYFVDLVVREGMTMTEAVQFAQVDNQARKAAGWDQAALDKAAAVGLSNGAFEDSEEEGSAVVEEFYNAAISGDQASPVPPNTPANSPSLTDRLREKAEADPIPA
jgi:hypothetical protein